MPNCRQKGNDVVNRLIQGISEQVLRHYSRWLAPLLALCLLALLAQLLWRSYQTYLFAPQIDRIITAVPQQQQYNIATITQGNLFGRALVSPAAAKLPVTNLQLILRGAFGASTPEKGIAMIEGGDSITRSYRVNMQVSANTRLHGVFTNHVVLSRDGQLETLEFPSPAGTVANNGTGSSGSTFGSGTGNDTGNRRPINTTTSQRVDATAMSAQQRQQLIKSRLQELRNGSKNKG
jgi:general secretion pathway protein C